MKILFQWLTLALLMCACENKEQNADPAPDEQIDFSVARVYIEPFGTLEDTTGNRIRVYSFYDKVAYGGMVGQFTLFVSERSKYFVRYVGQKPLLGSLMKPIGDKIGDNTAYFYINDELKGKPLFEVYRLSDKKLYKRYLASADTATIAVTYGVFNTPLATESRIKAFTEYYLQKKQTDDLTYLEHGD